MNLDNYQNDQYIWDSQAFPQKSNPNEDIVLIVRQDIIVLILRFLGGFVILIVLLLVKIFLFFSGLLASSPILDSLSNLFIIGYVLLFVLNFIYFFHNYYLSLQLVTTDRLIDIDQSGIFRREVDEIAIGNIQDVTYKQTGILQTFLGYGDVKVKTAGVDLAQTGKNDEAGFVFNNCSQPSKIASIVTDLFHQNKDSAMQNEAMTNAQELKKALDHQSQVNSDYKL